ncbi:Aldo/keto reductase, partial [Ramicandelaber brevisporus]
GAGVFSGRYENGFDVESPDETAYAAVRQAYDLGIRCFDTSPYYNDSERVLGRALARLRRETGIQRSDYMTITKTGRYGPCKPDFDFTAARTRQSVATSIARLYGRYLDAVLCHDVEFEDDPNVIVNGALTELFKLKSEGFVKRVGISGYPLNVLLDIAQRCQSRGHPLDLVLSYCNHNLHSRLLADYLPQLRQAGVKTILNASPLSMGLLRPSGPPSWHPANIELRSAV